MSRPRKTRRAKSKGLNLGHVVFIAGIVVAAFQAVITARRQPNALNDLGAGIAVARAVEVF